MNRVIKFRAWDDFKKEMVYCDGLHYWAFFNSPDSIGYGLYHRNDSHRVLSGEYNPPVMQFTGLQDKNGKEIFEGDVIRDTLTTMMSVVKFGHCKKHAFVGWYVENEELGYVSRINGDYETPSNSQIEVIGNVFENPELITS